MKKKAIEKIPYIGIERTSRKKGAKYIAATMVKIVGHEKHLITEVYRNKKEDLAVPLVRIVLTKKDFGTFFVESGEWSRCLISGTCYVSKYPIWDKCGREYNAEKENVIRSDEDLQRIKSFPGVEEKKWRNQTWYELINDRIDDIATKERRARENRRWERRQQGLKERAENTPEIDEQKLLEYADRVIFREKHYLYYKKRGAWARVACSKCGGVDEYRWKPGISYESQFQRMIDEPRQGGFGICPMCRARGEWKPQGTVQDSFGRTSHIFIGQKYKGTGMVFRYFAVWKEYRMELVGGDNGPVMENACEELSGAEIARVYFEEGKKPQKDYHKQSTWNGKDFWDDCNLYGMANISIDEAPILRETWEAMKGTILQYSAMKEYEAAEGSCINPVDYAERYLQTPQIEMLVKLGLIKVVDNLVKCRYGIVANDHADRVDSFLGIRKEHIRQLIRYQGDLGILKVMKIEKQMGQRWSDEQIECLEELGIDTMARLDLVLGHMGVQTFLNLIGKYAGAGYGTGCSHAVSRLRSVKQTYFDYLGMRQELGYDLGNTVYLMPKDLDAAHQAMVMEFNKKEADARIREVQMKFPMIRKHYRRLRRKFYYEDGGFIIRPARDAGEIVKEGRLLHHCVGGNNYLEKHNDGESVILFLRCVKTPDVPYITVEIRTDDLKLMQWYGAHDKKPDKENMGRWLDVYVTKLKCGLTGTEEAEDAGEKTEIETEAEEERVLAVPA